MPAFVPPDTSIVVNNSTSRVISVRQRRRRTFAAPTATNFRENYANIHTTYRSRRRINAICWSWISIARPCCTRCVQHRDQQHMLCHFDHVLSTFVRSAPGGTLFADAISNTPNHRRHWPKSISYIRPTHLEGSICMRGRCKSCAGSTLLFWDALRSTGTACVTGPVAK